VLRGETETLLESGAVTLFFPHGVGHMVGLGIRDAGAASDESREPVPGMPRLRVDIPLEPRHVWTVEPGIYFVGMLLEPFRAGASSADFNWPLIDALAPFGGIRVEDNVLVTEKGHRNLTREHLPN